MTLWMTLLNFYMTLLMTLWWLSSVSALTLQFLLACFPLATCDPLSWFPGCAALWPSPEILLLLAHSAGIISLRTCGYSSLVSLCSVPQAPENCSVCQWWHYQWAEHWEVLYKMFHCNYNRVVPKFVTCTMQIGNFAVVSPSFWTSLPYNLQHELLLLSWPLFLQAVEDSSVRSFVLCNWIWTTSDEFYIAPLQEVVYKVTITITKMSVIYLDSQLQTTKHY